MMVMGRLEVLAIGCSSLIQIVFESLIIVNAKTINILQNLNKLMSSNNSMKGN